LSHCGVARKAVDEWVTGALFLARASTADSMTCATAAAPAKPAAWAIFVELLAVYGDIPLHATLPHPRRTA
jgi:hypothetical protein